MPELIEKDRRGDKIYYEPCLLKVSGVSKYNSDQISFEGLPDFWKWTEWAASATGRAEPLPKGTVAWFALSTNPKRGQNAKPGSLYRDITSVSRATEEQKAAYVSPVNGNGSYQDKELPAASQNGSGASNGYTSRDASILKQVGFKAAVELLCAKMAAPKSGYDPYTAEEWHDLAFDVFHSYHLLMKGQNPASITGLGDDQEPEQDEPQSVADAAELDSQAEAHLGDPPWEEKAVDW